jgi:hypothetical protein
LFYYGAGSKNEGLVHYINKYELLKNISSGWETHLLFGHIYEQKAYGLE